MKLRLLFFFLLSASWAQAQWSIRPQAGLGYTDNANYEDTQKDADFFWWLRSSNSYRSQSSTWNLWLSYRSYLKERQNNVFSYRLGDTINFNSRTLGDLDWDLAFGGQQYPEGNPATTEESFNNFYFETSLLKTWEAKNDLELSFEPLYQFKYFPQLSGRADNTLAFNFAMDWQANPAQSLNPFTELGFVFSNQAIYSRYYWEIGTDWKIHPEPDLKYILHFSSRFSTFPNRTISEATVVTDRRGRVRTVSQDEMETQTLVQAQGSVVKMLEKAELRGTVGLNSQNSRSGYETYTETQVLASVLVPFDFTTTRRR